MNNFNKILDKILEEDSSQFISNHINTCNDDLLQAMLEKDNDNKEERSNIEKEEE